MAWGIISTPRVFIVSLLIPLQSQGNTVSCVIPNPVDVLDPLLSLMNAARMAMSVKKPWKIPMTTCVVKYMLEMYCQSRGLFELSLKVLWVEVLGRKKKDDDEGAGGQPGVEEKGVV